MKQLFPGEPIEVRGSGKDVVRLRHRLEQIRHREGRGSRRRLRREEGERRQPAETAGRRRLEPGHAESAVRRSQPQRAEELGRPSSPNGYKNDWFGRTTTQQFPAPDFDSDTTPAGLVFSDFLNLFLFNTQEGLGGVVRALQNKGLFQSLAEPNLIATNGKEASFLAGGEFPYPVVQAGAGGNAVTIMFKEFGIRLNFTPTVLGDDLINLKVKPEVSALDFANAVMSRASVSRRSPRAGPRPKSNCATARRSRSPG